ncbi:MAG TPA: hypothetical protein VEL79_10050 [Vicinamibacterales bacterium]|nr:hypothetical protein [Vicinamibacterales bacterium]
MNVKDSVIGHAVLCALVSLSACSRISPVGPTSDSARPLQQGQPLSPALPSTPQRVQHATAAAASPLLAGSFAIANADGDGIRGTYSGTAQFSDGAFEHASLTLQISDGSGALAGAGGVIPVAGLGSFVGEGDFLLQGHGEMTLAGGQRAILAVTLQGSSFASCSDSGQITISQSAAGAMGRVGRVSATLQHTVGGAGCIQ